jgi:adenosylcobinamide amidohydrolase
VICLPASEVIEAVMAAAKAQSSGLERELTETLARAQGTMTRSIYSTLLPVLY